MAREGRTHRRNRERVSGRSRDSGQLLDNFSSDASLSREHGKPAKLQGPAASGR